MVLDALAFGAPFHVLVVDPDAATAERLRRALTAAELGARVSAVSALGPALGLVRSGGVACVVTELTLPGGDGPEVVRRLRTAQPGIPVVVHAALPSPDVAVVAMKRGAADVVPKHPGADAALAAAVREAAGRAVLAALDDAAVPGGPAGTADDGLLVAGTPAMRHVLGLVDRAAGSRVCVLIEGETGTGKDLVARAIHQRGPHADAPFLAQNCAALAETLLESELFGHRRGAFTGADRDRAGLFAEAGPGTVFLDEVGEAPPAVQAKLLRVLQQGEVKAVGADRPHPVRARIVAATNRRLADEVAAGRFRADLYWRLAVFPIVLPPLRHRAADVPALAERFRLRFEREERRTTGGFAPEALAALGAHPWPGNVRELEHEVHRLVLTVPAGRRIRSAHLAPRIRAAAAGTAQPEPLARVLARVELALIRQRLAVLGTKAATARSLGITREALYGKLRRLGLRAHEE
jgi:DNA-binding NtrC family response regulator